MWTLQLHFLPPSPWEQRPRYPLHRRWASPRALLDDVKSSCGRSVRSLSRYWQPRSLHKFDLLTVMPVPEICTAPKGSIITEQWIGKDVEEAVVGLVDVLAYDLPRGTDKNHENFIQHNRRSGEIRRAAPPKKQEGVAVPANSLYITHAYYYYYYYYYYYFSCHRPFLPGTSLEPAVIPTAQASSFTLQYFPYYVWCSKYSCLL